MLRFVSLLHVWYAPPPIAALHSITAENRSALNIIGQSRQKCKRRTKRLLRPRLDHYVKWMTGMFQSRRASGQSITLKRWVCLVRSERQELETSLGTAETSTLLVSRQK